MEAKGLSTRRAQGTASSSRHPRAVTPGGRALLLVAFLAAGPASLLHAQAPAGLARAVLEDASHDWIRTDAPSFRAYFLPGSYALSRRDSLLARLPGALARARTMIGAPALGGPIDVFFIESREQMAHLTGRAANGYAEWQSRTVILVATPDWQAFAGHEIMHIVAGETWGLPAPGTDWLQEGLAQEAHGTCAGFENARVLSALAGRYGWIPASSLLDRFRRQPDLRAYLQAAEFVGFLLERYRPEELSVLWRQGADSGSMLGGETLSAIEDRWSERFGAEAIEESDLARIESKGCG